MEGSKESREGKIIEIAFGTIFTVPKPWSPDRKDVITDIGSGPDGPQFESSRVNYDEEGNMLLVGGGSGIPEDIGEIIGRLSEKEVIDAFKRGMGELLHRKNGKAWSKEFEEVFGKNLRKNAKKKPVKVTLLR